MKAQFVEKFYDTDKNPVLVYEYRNHKYEVVDYGWKGGEPLSWQHKLAQAHIDEIISREEKATNFKGENAQVGFDLFWAYVNGEEI